MTTTTDYLKYANLQMASEALLDKYPYKTYSGLVEALEKGNGHASKFPTLLAEEFASTWEVVAHQPNTDSGFSGTLFRAIKKIPEQGIEVGDLVMSFRSTEFVDDALRDSEGTNAYIASNGWAFGQIADMEKWYQKLITDGILTQSSQIDVTGYSLGGHLATAFAILRNEARELSLIKHIYTFNGAGTGGIANGYTLTAVMGIFKSVLAGAEPLGMADSDKAYLMRKAQADLDAYNQECIRVRSLSDSAGNSNTSPAGNLFTNIRYWYALEVASFNTTTGAISPFDHLDITNPKTWGPTQPTFTDARFMFSNMMTELRGSGPSMVATSGLRHSTDRLEVQIEDQPYTRGLPLSMINKLKLSDKWDINDFADTHSLVPIVDSLAVMDTICRLDEYVTMNDLKSLFKSATKTKAETIPGSQGLAEGNTLETIVDSLSKIFTKKGDSKLRNLPGISMGNTWWDIGNRNKFYGVIDEIKKSDGYKKLVGIGGFFILSGTSVDSIVNVATANNAPNGISMAYRYALKELNPFIVSGIDYSHFNPNGELDLPDPVTGSGSISNAWITDRAKMLSALLQANILDTDTIPASGSDGLAIGYYDWNGGKSVMLRDSPIQSEHKIIFGSDHPDLIMGDNFSDRLYGGGGDDVFVGYKGDDYLEGGAGNDFYFIDTGDGTDTIEDKQGNNKIFANGKALLLLIKQSDGSYKNPDGKITATIENTDLIVRDAATGNKIAILNKDFQEGDFGIHFKDAPTISETTRTIVGDLTPIDYDSSKDGVQMQTDNLNNIKCSNAPMEGRSDLLYDDTGNERIEGAGGNDFIYQGKGDDLVLGGDGRDGIGVIEGVVTGNDIIEGGAGADAIYGGDGDDQLFAESYGEMADLIAAGETTAGVGEQGDIIGGGDGDDNIYGSNRNDALFGGKGEDLLVGGAGDDFISSGGNFNGIFYTSNENNEEITYKSGSVFGWTFSNNFDGSSYNPAFTNMAYVSGEDDTSADVIYAGTGNDFIYSAGGDDEVYAEAGNDVVFGWGGGDFISGGDGDDVLIGDNSTTVLALEKQGDDYIDGGDGNDKIWGNGGNDDLFGGAGDDELWSGIGNNYLDGEAGDDQLYGEEGNDQLFGGDGNDYLDDTAGDNYLDGEAGNDTIVGGSGIDQIMGGDGDDKLYGEAGDDQLMGGDGNDYLEGNAGDDYLDGGSGDNTLLGGDGNDRLFVSDGTNMLSGGNGDDEIYGGSDIDKIWGDVGNDTIFGGAGMDEIQGDAGNDYLDGGDGVDLIDGGAGNDQMQGGGGDDRLQGRAGNDYLDGEDGNDTLLGGKGDDTLFGGDGNDALQGDEGHNVLSGGAGDDTYYLDLKNGDNVIYDDFSGSEHNQIVVVNSDIATNNLVYTWRDGQLYVTYKTSDSGGRRGTGGFTIGGGGSGSGTVSSTSGNTDWGTGGFGWGFGGGDLGGGVASGGGGGYFPFNYGDIEWIDGRHGRLKDPNDSDYDEAKKIRPPERRDPLVLDLDGDGVESAKATSSTYFDHDCNGLAESTGWIGKDDGLLALDRNGDGAITSGAELFGDETVLVTGRKAADGFEALKEFDSNKDGVISADDLVFNKLRVWRDANSDAVSSPEELLDLNSLGIKEIRLNSQAVNTTDANGNTVVRIGTFAHQDGSESVIADYGLEISSKLTVDKNTVEIPDDIAALPNLKGSGTVYDLRTAMAKDASGRLRGLVADFVNAPDIAARNQIMEQILYAWSGTDSVATNSRGSFFDGRKLAVIEAFMGETFVGLSGSNPNASAAPLLDNIYTNIEEKSYALLLMQTRFKDVYGQIRSVWDDTHQKWVADLSGVTTTIKAALEADHAAGKELLADFARTFRVSNSTTTLAYLNFRESFVGADQELGWLFDSGGLPVTNAPTGSSRDEAMRYTQGGSHYFSGSAGNDVIYGSSESDQIQNDSGDAVLVGGGGIDYIYAGDGADIIDGGQGEDYLYGGIGNDSYLFRKGSGRDTIFDYDEAANNYDTVYIGSSLSPDDVTVKRAGFDLILTIANTDDSLTILNWFAGEKYQVERVMFSDGTEWDIESIKQKVLLGTEGDDDLTGYDTSEVISGLGGNDRIIGGNGDDTLSGGAGKDHVNGGLGNDIIDGGAGNDILSGGDISFDSQRKAISNGNDTYIFARGYGQDTIIDNDPTAGNMDTILIRDVLPSEVNFKVIGHDLAIEISGTDDRLVVSDWLRGDQYRIERIVFDDGTSWDNNTIQARFQAPSNSDDWLVGTPGNDALDGGGG